MSTLSILLASLVLASSFGFGTVTNSIRETKPPVPVEKPKPDPIKEPGPPPVYLATKG